jgi:Flp pilus assembly protein TadD
MRAAPLLALALQCAAVVGCGPSPPTAEDRVKDATAFRKEQAPDRLLLQGRAFAAVGDTTRAEQYLAAALAGGGDDHAIVPLLIEVCVADGRFRSAIEYAEPFVQKHPQDTHARFLLGTLYDGIGAFDRARAEYESVVASKPDAPDPHWALGILLRDEVKDPVLADTHFREYLRLSPSGEHADEARASLLKEVP